MFLLLLYNIFSPILPSMFVQCLFWHRFGMIFKRSSNIVHNLEIIIIIHSILSSFGSDLSLKFEMVVHLYFQFFFSLYTLSFNLFIRLNSFVHIHSSSLFFQIHSTFGLFLLTDSWLIFFRFLSANICSVPIYECLSCESTFAPIFFVCRPINWWFQQTLEKTHKTTSKKQKHHAE